MSWALGEWAAYDSESTGTDVEGDRIVTATVVQRTPGCEPAMASHLIAVDVDIPAEATGVHGITTDHARANGKPAAEVLEAVAAHLAELLANGIPVIGANLCFDLTLLDRECRRNGLPTLEARLGREPAPLIDVYVIDKALDRYRKGSRKLVDLCAHYGARIDNAHEATSDALAAARVAYQMARRAALPADELRALYADLRYPGDLVRAFQAFGALSLADLHEAQRGWYAAQAESFAQYLRRMGNEAEHRSEVAGDDAERETARQDAVDLRRRADEVSADWPVRPWAGVA